MTSTWPADLSVGWLTGAVALSTQRICGHAWSAGRVKIMHDVAGGIFGGGGDGPSKKELDEFGEDDDNMMSKAEVPSVTGILQSLRRCCSHMQSPGRLVPAQSSLCEHPHRQAPQQ